MTTSPVAFLGLGRMGAPMALNLARAGHQVQAWNRTPKPLPDAPIGSDGSDGSAAVTMAGSVAEAVAGTDIVVAMLNDLPDVVSACAITDDDIGHLSSARRGVVLVLMGTYSPRAVQSLAAHLLAHDVHVVDAPVSGGDVGARDATLSIMVGGSDLDVERVRPILAALGSSMRHVGPVGSGQLVKAANQIVVGATLAALGEALVLAQSGGVERRVLLDILAPGLAGSRALDLKRDKLIGRDYQPGGAAAAQLKDLGFALDAARGAGVCLPLTAVVDQLYGAMAAMGLGEDDHSGIVQVIERMSR